MELHYWLDSKDLLQFLDKAEDELLKAEKIKFEKSKSWREEFIPSFPGVYALFENKKTLLYIGETGNLRDRMNEICRTVNHTFRKQLGHIRFGAIKTSKKFDPETEALLDLFFKEKLHVCFIKVNLGRAEIETHLITKYQKTLLNSEKKRKLKVVLEKLED